MLAQEQNYEIQGHPFLVWIPKPAHLLYGVICTQKCSDSHAEPTGKESDNESGREMGIGRGTADGNKNNCFCSQAEKKKKFKKKLKGRQYRFREKGGVLLQGSVHCLSKRFGAP